MCARLPWFSHYSLGYHRPIVETGFLGKNFVQFDDSLCQVIVYLDNTLITKQNS